MSARGFGAGKALPALLPVLLTLAACAVAPEAARVDRHSAAENLPKDPAGNIEEIPEFAELPETADSRAAEDAIDPLAEVARLWYGGLPGEARARFRQDDAAALSRGSRRSEWSIWRGRLFTERWSGEDLGLAGSNVSALLSDNDDIWAGTWTGGVVRLSEPLNEHTAWDPGLPSLAVRTVNSITRYGDSVWLVRYGTLERYDLRSGAWTFERDLPERERLQDVYATEQGVYLATLGRGLWKKDGRGWEMIRNPGLFITNLEPGPDGTMIVMTMDRGLYLHDPVSGDWRRPPEGAIRDANVTSAAASGNKIYGGTYGTGGFVWDTADGTVSNLDARLLGDPYVLAVAVANGRVYFGTFGAGVVSWNTGNGTWDRISLEEGLPSADIAALETDREGNLWAGTLGGGIVKISGDIHGD